MQALIFTGQHFTAHVLLTAEGARNTRGFKAFDERCFTFALLAGLAVSFYLTAGNARHARGFKAFDERCFTFVLLAGLAVSFY